MKPVKPGIVIATVDAKTAASKVIVATDPSTSTNRPVTVAVVAPLEIKICPLFGTACIGNPVGIVTFMFPVFHPSVGIWRPATDLARWEIRKTSFVVKAVARTEGFEAGSTGVVFGRPFVVPSVSPKPKSARTNELRPLDKPPLRHSPSGHLLFNKVCTHDDSIGGQV